MAYPFTIEILILGCPFNEIFLCFFFLFKILGYPLNCFYMMSLFF